MRGGQIEYRTIIHWVIKATNKKDEVRNGIKNNCNKKKKSNLRNIRVKWKNEEGNKWVWV